MKPDHAIFLSESDLTEWLAERQHSYASRVSVSKPSLNFLVSFDKVFTVEKDRVEIYKGIDMKAALAAYNEHL